MKLTTHTSFADPSLPICQGQVAAWGSPTTWSFENSQNYRGCSSQCLSFAFVVAPLVGVPISFLFLLISIYTHVVIFTQKGIGLVTDAILLKTNMLCWYFGKELAQESTFATGSSTVDSIKKK